MNNTLNLSRILINFVYVKNLTLTLNFTIIIKNQHKMINFLLQEEILKV